MCTCDCLLQLHSAGKDAVTSGKYSLAAKLAASPVWLSLTLDAETFPSTGQQVRLSCVPVPLSVLCLKTLLCGSLVH